jgi:uncharacterized membrane protein YphA (DoxX/SURF4 family)
MTARSRNIAFWITTVLFCFPMGAGGVMDLVQPPDALAQFQHLGYPQYLLTILGVAKVLGVIILLAPGLPRLKEWAYAGLVIDLVGASASHAFVGDAVAYIALPLGVLAVGLASYFLRPESRRLPNRA